MKELFEERTVLAFNGVESTNPLDYVHPYRRKDLCKMISSAPVFVEVLILFGSSLGDYLLDSSDLDLLVISKKENSIILEWLNSLGLEAKVDLFILPSVDELISQAENYFPVAKAVIEEGLVVYIKDSEVKIHAKIQ
jgi:predicted nucleotidyltransferase